MRYRVGDPGVGVADRVEGARVEGVETAGCALGIEISAAVAAGGAEGIEISAIEAAGGAEAVEVAAVEATRVEAVGVADGGVAGCPTAVAVGSSALISLRRRAKSPRKKSFSRW